MLTKAQLDDIDLRLKKGWVINRQTIEALVRAARVALEVKPVEAAGYSYGTKLQSVLIT